ncbi:MAG: arylesterase [Pseudomonadales bacterium]|nr:arylesterase [Pseudomonadales bacterium]
MQKIIDEKSLALLCIQLLLAAILFLTTSAANSNPPQNLLIMGDSLSAGYGINREKDWASLLATHMKATHPHIRVINASISGETTSGALARLPAILASTHPHWVLITLGANDGLRGQSLNAMENNLNNIVTLIQQHGGKALLAGIRLPPNYGKVFNTRFHAVYVNIAKNKNLPLLPFLLKDVGGNMKLMQNDGLHPNEAAQTIMFETVRQFLSEICRQHERKNSNFSGRERNLHRRALPYY